VLCNAERGPDCGGCRVENVAMTDLTAAEVQALAALADNRPMTVDELARSMSDVGMHLGSDQVTAIVQRLVDMGMAERTPAASLGKYRTTTAGLDWIRSRSA
jgi:predicted transcriptional regulator